MFRTDSSNREMASHPSLAYAGWVVSSLGSGLSSSRWCRFAIRDGVDVRLTVVGGIGFVPGYEKLIHAFPYRDRLRWEKGIPRDKVPAFLGQQDLLIQPSDEENFGSSVAEAQHVGFRSLLGGPMVMRTISAHETFISGMTGRRPGGSAARLAQRKAEGRRGDPGESRRCAEEYFGLDTITGRLIEFLRAYRFPADDHWIVAELSRLALRIGLLSAAFPPDFDGIGDYTYWLAGALARRAVQTSVWTSTGKNRASPEGVEVHPFFQLDRPKSVELLPELLERGANRLVRWCNTIPLAMESGGTALARSDVASGEADRDSAGCGHVS